MFLIHLHLEEVSIHVRIIQICCDKILDITQWSRLHQSNPLQHLIQLINNFNF